MTRIFYSKKGVSPIIATVLLVAITIAIGATTMAFIRSLSDTQLASSKEKENSIKCGTEVFMEVVYLNGDYQVCNDNSSQELRVLYHNKGVDVKGFQFVVIENNGSVWTGSSAETLDKDEYKNLVFDYTESGFTDPTNTTISQFILSPKIQGSPSKGLVVCADMELKFDGASLRAC